MPLSVVLRTGWTAGALGCVVNAPSTLGPSSYRGVFRNQVSRLRASKGNNSSVSGKSAGPVSFGNAGFPQLTGSWAEGCSCKDNVAWTEGLIARLP